MTPDDAGDGPLSFLGITIRRSLVTGRVYLIYGCVMSVLLGISLGATGGSAFSTAYPLILPIFTVVGGMGALMVFSNDRLKGVLEYLMAYGVSPKRQFVNVLVASFVLVSVLLGIALGASLTFYVLRGHVLDPAFGVGLVVYTVPMSYASEAFATTVGMFWTALSTPRAGLTSPTGFAPFIGILPSVATLGAVIVVGVSTGAVTEADFLTIAGVAMGLVAVTVVALVGSSDRLLRRERLLSPA